MTGATGRDPRDFTADELVRLLERANESSAIATRQIAGDVRELLQLLQTPADIRTMRLTAARPLRTDDVGAETVSASIGVLNPNAFAVFVGLAGARADANAIVVPAARSIVVPVSAGAVELGAAAADLAGADAVVHLFRFSTVQALSLG